jgi:hypothetical protein
MLLKPPKPEYTQKIKPEWLPERKQMTLIGVLPTLEGVVLFADRQETITDYAKWDVGKISMFEIQDVFRVFSCGAGQTSTIEMIREEVWDTLKTKFVDLDKLKDLIVETVAETTKKRIFPRNEGSVVEHLWVIQYLVTTQSKPFPGIDVFKTEGLDVNKITKPYFSGNPMLLTQFLSDMYLKGTIFGMDEAEALAAYFLWEAKEYDPTCGKHSDIYLIRRDRGLSRQSREDVRYWEEHFELLKESLRFLPLLSCSTNVMQKVFNQKDMLERLQTTVRVLSSEQNKWRKKTVKRGSALEEKLGKTLRRVALKHQARQESKGS